MYAFSSAYPIKVSSLSQPSQGERQGVTWTGHQNIAKLTQRGPTIHTHTCGQFYKEFPINMHVMSCGGKLYLECTYGGKRQTCKHHTDTQWIQTEALLAKQQC